MVLLELRRDSRVMTGNLGFLLLALKSNLPFGLRGGAGDCARVTAGQKRPNLGLCPGSNVALQGRQGSRVCIPDSSGESVLTSRVSKEFRSRLESRLSSRLGISWSPLCVLKGVKPPVEFGERTRDWTPGHAGKEGPHLEMTVASRGFSRAAAPVWGVS